MPARQSAAPVLCRSGTPNTKLFSFRGAHRLLQVSRAVHLAGSSEPVPCRVPAGWKKRCMLEASELFTSYGRSTLLLIGSVCSIRPRAHHNCPWAQRSLSTAVTHYFRATFTFTLDERLAAGVCAGSNRCTCMQTHMPCPGNGIRISTGAGAGHYVARRAQFFVAQIRLWMSRG